MFENRPSYGYIVICITAGQLIQLNQKGAPSSYEGTRDKAQEVAIAMKKEHPNKDYSVMNLVHGEIYPVVPVQLFEVKWDKAYKPV